MSEALTVVVVCPQCGEFDEAGYAFFMKGNRPLCDFCGKTRMRKATEQERQNYLDGRSGDGIAD